MATVGAADIRDPRLRTDRPERSHRDRRNGADSNALIVTGQQRAYLDALKAAGVKPSSDLLALSIGSYVCQARAAKQSDQAVWDFVVPLVRSDVRDAHLSADGAADR